jgi:hypothetical protein
MLSLKHSYKLSIYYLIKRFIRTFKLKSNASVKKNNTTTQPHHSKLNIISILQQLQQQL